MNWFRKLVAKVKGALKIRPGELKVNHKDVLPPGTESVINANVGAAVDAGAAQVGAQLPLPSGEEPKP